MAGSDSERSPGKMDPMPVVGIGASAGGITALTAFFEAVPADVGAAFVVIIHLDPDARSELASILGSRTKLPVAQVKDAVELRANCIYVIPPDRQLQISDHQVRARPFDEPRGHRAPVDLFFRSLAEQRGDGFAVILSGAGSDGAAGAQAVREHGGIVLVQSPEEAEYSSMPRAAIAAEAVDFVLPVRQLAERIAELVVARGRRSGGEKVDEEDQLRHILAHLRVKTGNDFSTYKRSTVLRRIQRRSEIVGRDSLAAYLRYLRESSQEPQLLLADLLISVTQFFRDPEAFDSLRKRAIAPLFNRETSGEPLRVWVIGCATGEEAYSVAMLMFEEAALHDIRPEMQIFASDLDARALSFARNGRFPVAIEADMSEERLHRFFSRDQDHYCVKRELRDAILFANHSVLKDPPFARIDLISCRNLLIYLDRELQKQLLVTLNYSLNPTGYLFLGASESADRPEGLFRAVDRGARLYQSTGRAPEGLPAVPRVMATLSQLESHFPGPATAPLTMRVAATAHLDALETLAPPSMLVDAAFRVVHLSEKAGRYFMPSGGPLTADVTELVRPELRFELRRALHRAWERGETTLSSAASVRFNGKPIRVYLHVKPVETSEGERKQALVMFVEGEEHEPLTAPDGLAETNLEAIHGLRRELDHAQTQLRTMREESETANEELRAKNEELQSINEEYRSTAEELETSKEELQSINEELQTVNSELKLKLDSVSRANSDLQNLMAATDFGTLFLDGGLRIRRFTPKLAELFNIAPIDVGRPITDFTHHLDYDGLAADARHVLTELTPLERQIQSRGNHWYMMRCRPYRTLDDKMDGVVVTFVDVTDRKRLEDALRKSELQLRQENWIVDQSAAPVLVWDFATGAITQWNKGCEQLFGYPKNEAVGNSMESLLKSTVAASSFASVRKTLSKEGVWLGEIGRTTKSEKAIRTESSMVLLSVGGGQFVLERSRAI